MAVSLLISLSHVAGISPSNAAAIGAPHGEGLSRSGDARWAADRAQGITITESCHSRIWNGNRNKSMI